MRAERCEKCGNVNDIGMHRHYVPGRPASPAVKVWGFILIEAAKPAIAEHLVLRCIWCSYQRCSPVEVSE